MNKLYEIRCPFETLNKKTNQKQVCNHLCVKVQAGSSGEIKCRHCGKVFQFNIHNQATSSLGIQLYSKPYNENKEQKHINTHQEDN